MKKIFIGALVMAAGLAGSWFVRGTPQQGGSVAEKIHLPKPEELGRVMPAEPVSPAEQRRDSSSISDSRSAGRSSASGSNSSLVPSAQQLRKLQEEGGVIY